MNKKKLIRITTVPMSLDKLLEGQLRFMNDYFDVIAVSSDEKELKKVGVREGINTYSIEMTRKISPVKDLKALIKLYRFLKIEKPQIVHSHTPKAGIVGMLAAKLAGVPHRLHTVAGLPLMEATGIKRRILNSVEKLTYSCASKIYPNSFGLQHFIYKEKFTSSKKVKVLANGSSNGIDCAYFDRRLVSRVLINQLRQEMAISSNDFVFIFVGRVVGDKGINELVKAFDSLSKKINGVKLLLVGPKEEDLDPLDEITKLVMIENQNIIVTGYQDDVRPYFAISNVLVFPSYREGFPNVVMQAGAMELPCIVSDINGCNEIITSSKNGLIIPVKNTGSIEQAMKYFVEQPKDYNIMKESARGMITKKYQRALVLHTLLEEYINLD